MKVAVCTLPLKSDHQTRGIGSYTRNLVEELQKHQDICLQQFGDIKDVKTADVVHFPFFDLFKPTLPLVKKFPTVVTIHDVTPLVFKQHYPPGIKGSINFLHQKISLKSVKAIITDSLSSKNDIAKYLDVESSKIFPVYLAAGKNFKKIDDINILNKVIKKYNLPGKFVFYVGNVNWNKNLLNLTEACLRLNIDLVLVGKSFEQRDNLNHVELKSFKTFLDKYENNPKVHMKGFIPEEDLVILYNLAFVTLLPSYYEGFGLPILESQLSGTPVITSKVSSMTEVAGDGAIFIDPNKIDDIKNAINKLSSDDRLANSLIKKGFENVKKFSWKKTVDETIKIYQYASSK